MAEYLANFNNMDEDFEFDGHLTSGSTDEEKERPAATRLQTSADWLCFCGYCDPILWPYDYRGVFTDWIKQRSPKPLKSSVGGSFKCCQTLILTIWVIQWQEQPQEDVFHNAQLPLRITLLQRWLTQYWTIFQSFAPLFSLVETQPANCQEQSAE